MLGTQNKAPDLVRDSASPILDTQMSYVDTGRRSDRGSSTWKSDFFYLVAEHHSLSQRSCTVPWPPI